jgi:sigma-B regulation protein RsbU (phosphoserine phosphatase)
LREGGLLLGVRSGEAYPEEQFLLEPGDRLLIYTDGVVEATSPEDLEFGNERLEEFTIPSCRISLPHV